MNAMSRKEADACVEESLAYDDASGRIRVRNGKLSGLLLIEARDLKEAIQVAAKMPMARRGSIEVRPIKELRPRGEWDEGHVHDLPRRERAGRDAPDGGAASCRLRD